MTEAVMDKALIRDYFNEHSQSWITGAYEGDGYVFPTALARVSKIIKIITQECPDPDIEIVDVGCGAGQLCFELAGRGYRMTGIDQSEAMLSKAKETLASLPDNLQSRLRLVQGDLLDNDLTSHSFDALTAMGVIGYLPSDEVFFREATRLLKPRGLLVVSCRNRLFNMISISDYTLREINSGNAKELIEEIRDLFQKVPEKDAIEFIRSLANAAGTIRMEESLVPISPRQGSFPTSSSCFEARQQTPKQLKAIAQAQGFEPVALYGIHPHLLIANVNQLLPPGIFNVLSRSLETLDHLPVSLVWSSVFIAVFRLR